MCVMFESIRNILKHTNDRGEEIWLDEFANELKVSEYLDIECKRFYIIHYPVKENRTYKKS